MTRAHIVTVLPIAIALSVSFACSDPPADPRRWWQAKTPCPSGSELASERQHGGRRAHYCAPHSRSRYTVVNERGVIVEEGQYGADREEGVWTEFDDNGKVRQRVIWERGRMVSRTMIRADGTNESSEVFGLPSMGPTTGWVEYDESGVPLIACTRRPDPRQPESSACLDLRKGALVDYPAACGRLMCPGTGASPGGSQ